MQLLALFPQQKDFLAASNYKLRKRFFGIFSLAEMGVVGVTC